MTRSLIRRLGDVDFLRTAVLQAIGQGPARAMPAADAMPSPNGNGNHVATIPPANPDDGLVKMLLSRLSAMEERMQQPAAAPALPSPPKIRAHHEIAYELYSRA